MQIIEPNTNIAFTEITATIGFFDGVHIGHRSLLTDVNSIAQKECSTSGVITFKEHPQKILTGRDMPLITSLDERLIKLASTGINYCILLDFTPQISKMSSKEFIQYIRDNFKLKHLIIGYDHRFGHNRNETPDDYKRNGYELGVNVSQSRACMPNGVKVSSSVIRKLLISGKITDANILLSENYCIEGCVIKGEQLGRRIGFPTANILSKSQEKIIPANGAYAVRIHIPGDNVYNGMLNIGTRPTITNTNERSIEVNIFDFDRAIYNENIKIEFIAYIRPEQCMDSIESLQKQLHKDKEVALKILS